MLARPSVAAGSIEKLIESLPRKPLKGKARQQWLIKPDRTRAVDAEFLRYLDEQRRELASDIYRHNPASIVTAGDQLNEAVQRVIDRVLFLRICEDRDIDTGRPLARILDDWLENQPDSPLRAKPQPLPNLVRDDDEAARRYGAKPPPAPFYQALVRHFQALDRRPATHIPYFNGQLFKPHFSEELKVGDEFLANFIRDLSADDSNYLFSSLPVEILGSVYERFIGKTVRPKGVGITVDEKPEVRKAGGVYYTPRYIVSYIVEQTVGQLLAGKSPKQVEKLRILDPSCGSGSFLIRAYERVMEHHVEWFLAHPDEQRPRLCYRDGSGDLRLTTALKYQILTNNIYGVDIDGQAVEVTQLSLYLRMLQGETRQTMYAQRDFLGDNPILPPLEHNIKQGNSLIASDFSLVPEELTQVSAFSWQRQFPASMGCGGFDAVIGNPPWGQKAVEFSAAEKAYLREHYQVGRGILDLFKLFCERALKLTKPDGYWGMILPDIVLLKNYPETRRFFLENAALTGIAHAGMAFEQAEIDTVCLLCRRQQLPPNTKHRVGIVRELTEARVGSVPAKPDAWLPQSLFWQLRDYKFNIHLDANRLALLEKLEQLPKLGDNFEAHEGIHSGNIRAKLFLKE